MLAQDFAALERIWAEEFMVNSPFNRIAPNRAVVIDIGSPSPTRPGAMQL